MAISELVAGLLSVFGSPQSFYVFELRVFRDDASCDSADCFFFVLYNKWSEYHVELVSGQTLQFGVEISCFLDLAGASWILEGLGSPHR